MFEKCAGCSKSEKPLSCLCPADSSLHFESLCFPTFFPYIWRLAVLLHRSLISASFPLCLIACYWFAFFESLLVITVFLTPFFSFQFFALIFLLFPKIFSSWTVLLFFHLLFSPHKFVLYIKFRLVLITFSFHEMLEFRSILNRYPLNAFLAVLSSSIFPDILYSVPSYADFPLFLSFPYVCSLAFLTIFQNSVLFAFFFLKYVLIFSEECTFNFRIFSETLPVIK